MKHRGCILHFTHQRNDELIKAYRKAISSRKHIDISVVSEIVVNSPCSRFWVSEERALTVISAMMKDASVIDSMRPLKREMYKDIFDIVTQLRKEHPDMQLFDIVILAVNTPTKKFYIKPRCAMEIIYKIKKGHYDKNRR